MDKLLELFCDVDDFCAVFMPQWHQQLLVSGQRQRQRTGRMSASEIMMHHHCFPHVTPPGFQKLLQRFAPALSHAGFSSIAQLHPVPRDDAIRIGPALCLFHPAEGNPNRDRIC